MVNHVLDHRAPRYRLAVRVGTEIWYCASRTPNMRLPLFTDEPDQAQAFATFDEADAEREALSEVVVFRIEPIGDTEEALPC